MDNVLAHRRIPFVGRARELDALRAALDEAGRGHGGIALITGAPGIGKSRLAQELAQQAHESGWRVFLGWAYEADGTPPYLPFSEALRDYVRSCPLKILEAQLGSGAAEVAVVSRELLGRFPRLEESPPLSPEHERYRMWESVCDFLLEIAEASERGLLLVLDDLQWADRSSLSLLQHLARRTPGGRLLILGVYRRVEMAVGHPLAELLADLTREQAPVRITVGALTSDESAQLIEHVAGVPTAAAVATALHGEAEGNPFFMSELVRHIRTEGCDLSDSGADPSKWGIPDSVREVIGKRLSRLSPPAAQILQVAAVAGDRFSCDLVQAATQMQADQVLDALDEALRGELIREDGDQFQFNHTLIRQTIYRGLNAARRARLHRQVADAMEHVYLLYPEPHLAEVAHHLVQAGGIPDLARAVTYAHRAAERAVRLLAFEDAVSLFELALHAAETPGLPSEEYCDLLLGLADARRRSGQFQAAMEVFRRAADVARPMNSPERMAGASLGYEDALLAAGTARQGADDPSILLQREALRSLGEEHNALRARVLAALGQALHFSGVRDEAAEVTQQAVDLARELNDDGALARALNVQFIVMWGPTYPRERLAVLTDMIQAADSAGDEELVVEGTMWRLRTLNELGDMPQVEAEFDAYYERAEALREPQYRAHALSCKAAHAHLRGAMDQSAELFSQALSLGQLVQSPNLSTLFLAWQIDVARDRGDIELLRELRLEAEPIAQQVYPWRVFAMLMDCELGEMDAAREHFRTVARIDYQAMLQHWLGMRTASRLAEVCWRLDDDVEAARLYPVIVPYAEQYVIGDVALGSVSRYLGLLAATQRDWASAEKHFKVGLYLNGAIGHRFQTAHTQADFATVALRRGRADDAVLARELLQQALTSYRELGAEYHAERASALLSETSLPGPKARSTARPAGLTEREVEVVALIAAGRTNAEIAEALVLSVRTVERHITNAYAKIDARGKADATAFALRHGLVTPSS